jgi:ABC-type sulfate/molybdate transport systems ATPase subunit
MQELLTEIWETHRLTVLFVTHDIEEAVFISDRVVIMTPRPGRIESARVIDLPRPRRPEIQSDPHFHELADSLLRGIRQQSQSNQPSQPGRPGQPSQPDQTGQPSQPSQTGQPGQPSQPGQLSQSGQTDQLSQPDQSGRTG